jgi:Fic-DOC domain mobile mystery protein B
MGLDLSYIEGQTPIDEDEKEGLLIKTITTRGELDEFEQYNIEKAVEWTMKNTFKIDTILQENFILKIHKRMFDEVWNWAGKYRTSNKNIGADKYQIPIELRNLLDDCKYWIKKHSYREDEIAIRFKHRLVSIHLFPNGNGRHSRLCADILISHGFKKPIFTWNRSNLSKTGEARRHYLEAIYQADQGNYIPLIAFAKS